jgi:signal transduction histidine kinase
MGASDPTGGPATSRVPIPRPAGSDAALISGRLDGGVLVPVDELAVGAGDLDDRLADRAPIAPDAVERIRWVLRLVMLVLVGMLVVVTTPDTSATVWVCLLAVAALPAWTQPYHAPLALLGRVAEVVVTAMGASTLAATNTGATASALLPYLAVPVVVPALSGRTREPLALLGLAVACLAGAGILDGQFHEPGYGLVAVEWVVIAGLAAGFISTLQRRASGSTRAPGPTYAEATRLLTQLRAVARRLPGATLDPGGIGEHLIEEARAVVAADRAAVLSGSGGGRLVVLAQSAADRVDWETSLDADSGIAEAWASQQPQISSRSQSRTGAACREVTSLVLPLVAGVRTVGVLALEADRLAAFPPSVVDRLAALAEPAALRLEAALLFDDVRSIATNEERQRLAREIHDGIAQELVIIGYGIDNAIGELPEGADQSAEELRELREEVTRVIEELRLSLFELRSEVDRQGGLTAAVADYARTVSAAGGLRVHLSLEETPARLPASIEAELMRIAQEAINNARRHSHAENLWVTVEIDPPYARIEISDDGTGIGPHRKDGRLGLAIMAERAQRIRGQLHISPRNEGGTAVAVVLGTSVSRSPRAEQAGPSTRRQPTG